ncbi:nucleoside diphosphate kinase [Entophlyctis helioformis]|nr:nucleoside diphosphate kinase [Entophlyctis helioformis]
MSAHAKRAEVALAPIATSDDEWAGHLAKKGLRAKWAGPCEPMQTIFKRLKLDYGEDVYFIQAQSDYIESLKNLRNKSCPTFLFFIHGVLVKMVRGANAPLIERYIKELVDHEKTGQPHQHLIFDDKGVPILSGPLHTSPDHAPAAADPPPQSSVSSSSHAINAGSAAGSSPTLESPSTPAEETLALIKPDAMGPGTRDRIMEMIRINRFEVVRKKKIWMTDALVKEFYAEHADKPFFPALVTYLSSAPVIALVLKKDNAVAAWRQLMGPASALRAKEEAPKSIRAQFGTDARLNAVFGSLDVASASREIELIFAESTAPMTLALDEVESAPSNVQKTLALIKPDAVAKTEEIIERILCRGFAIVKREEVTLTTEMVGELHTAAAREDAGFNDVVAHLTSAPVVALVLKGDSVVSGWLEMCGPSDPAVAKETLPMSLRALYGTDAVKNGVHGSPTSDDAVANIHMIFPHVLTRSMSNISARPSTSAPLPQTQSEIHSRLERTLALIKPDAYPAKKDEIMARIRDEGFRVVKESEVQFDLAKAQEFYKEHAEKPFYGELTTWMSSAPIYAIVLEKQNGIGAWRTRNAPTSIRALHGTDGTQNAVHGSDSPASATREIGVVFGTEVSSIPEPLEYTLALIKPDAYGAGKKADICDRIVKDGFSIVKEAEITFTAEMAGEFYKEHLGKPFYETLVAWMSSAPIYAMVLEKVDGIKGWRALAGPTNSEKARETSPESIRALYGKDGSENAVHGSDSLPSAAREIGVVFGTDYALTLYPPAAPAPSGSVSALAGASSPKSVSPPPPAPAQEETKAERPPPISRTASQRAPSAGSKPTLSRTASASALGGKPLSRAGSAATKRTGASTANLVSSKPALAGSKANLGSKTALAKPGSAGSRPTWRLRAAKAILARPTRVWLAERLAGPGSHHRVCQACIVLWRTLASPLSP